MDAVHLYEGARNEVLNKSNRSRVLEHPGSWVERFGPITDPHVGAILADRNSAEEPVDTSGMSDPLAPVFEALDDFEKALTKLDAGCCDPGRSPRMRALAIALDTARRSVGDISSDTGGTPAVITTLEEMGAQIGRLQVGCCTEKRLPLYARMLDDLTDAQLALSRAAGTGH